MGNVNPIEVHPSQPNSVVHTMTGTSEHPDSIILGNNEQSTRVNEIFTNYIDSGESYNHKSIIVDIYFSTTVANNLLNYHDPKTIAECEKRSD